MAVDSSLRTWTDHKSLSKSKLFLEIHPELSIYTYHKTAIVWAFLNVKVDVLELDSLKAERLNFLLNFLESSEFSSTISHLACLRIEFN
jgi:hypothetical protein